MLILMTEWVGYKLMNLYLFNFYWIRQDLENNSTNSSLFDVTLN